MLWDLYLMYMYFELIVLKCYFTDNEFCKLADLAMHDQKCII